MKRSLQGYTIALMIIALCSIAIGVCAEEPNYGGTFICALASEPGTLDMALTTGVNENIVAVHVFESLFSFDADYSPEPDLATGYDLDESGMLATIYLREGVTFHDGSDFTAEDAVATLKRWGDYGLKASALFNYVEDLYVVDTYTLAIQLTQPVGALFAYLANTSGGPYMLPKEVVEATGGEPLSPENYIGTGPYTFANWVPGDRIVLERFDDYSGPSTPASGYNGYKIAYFDQMEFHFVPDDNARLVGIQAGTYDYVVNIPNDLLSTVADDANVVPILTDHPPIYPIALVNNRAGLTTNSAIKRAMIMALDMEAIMLAGYGDPTFWSLNPTYFAPGIAWYTENAGEGLYNASDPAGARQMAADAGYAGETIRIIVASDMVPQYNQALVVTSQLVEAGFNVSLNVYDKATFFARRNDKDNPQWELAFSYYSTIPDPSLVLMLSPTYAGWWDTPEIQVLREDVNRETDFDSRFTLWEEIMELWYEQIPAIKFGDAFQLHLIAEDIGGDYGSPEHVVMNRAYFFNLWRK